MRLAPSGVTDRGGVHGHIRCTCAVISAASRPYVATGFSIIPIAVGSHRAVGMGRDLVDVQNNSLHPSSAANAAI